MRAKLLRSLRAAACCILLATALAGIGISAAMAHAVLLETWPADGARLDRAPDEIVLRFSEPVMPVFVRLLDAAGQAVAIPDAPRATDREVRLALPRGLPEGGYIVSFRVASADSHPVGGSFLFSVGAATPAVPTEGLEPDSGRGWLLARIAVRAVQDAALLFAAGGGLFQLLMMPSGRPLRRRLRRGWAASAGIAAAAAILSVGVEGGLLAGASGAGLADPAVWRLGAATTVARTALIMVSSLGLMVLGLCLAPRKAASILIALAAVGAAGSLAFTGHAAASGPAGQAALALHSLLVAFWLGALWPLYLVSRARPLQEAAVIVRRFSRLAVPAVALLVLAGIGVALTRIGSPGDLIASPYGRLLLVKLALVGLLLSVAAVNRRRLTPALTAGSAAAAIRLARNIRLEIALAAGILGVTAILSQTAPPQGRMAPAHADRLQGGYAATATSRGYVLHFEMTPAGMGRNMLTVRLATPDGAAAQPLEVSIGLAMKAAGIEPLVRQPESLGDGTYRLMADLPVPGLWTLHVEALISDFEKAVFTLEVAVR